MYADIRARNRDPQLRSIPNKQRPSVMTALLVDDQVYLSSSMKGDAFMYRNWGTGAVNPDLAEPVRLGIAMCQTEGGGRHQNRAACGEPMVVQMFYHDRPNSNLAESNGTLTHATLEKPY